MGGGQGAGGMLAPGAASGMDASGGGSRAVLDHSDRKEALTRYRQKRKTRHFEKTIRYATRQVWVLQLHVILPVACNLIRYMQPESGRLHGSSSPGTVGHSSDPLARVPLS